jgi:hypothetical protein
MTCLLKISSVLLFNKTERFYPGEAAVVVEGKESKVILSYYEQLLECWNKLFALKQEFGNCP